MLMFEVLRKFDLLDKVISMERYGRGFLNRTFLINTTEGLFVIQMFDSAVVTNPQSAIHNIKTVLHYLTGLKEATYFINHSLVESIDNGKIISVDKKYWRCYKLNENTQLFKKVVNAHMMYEIGKGIGDFHFQLNNFPCSELEISIPNFHQTYTEYKKLIKTISKLDSLIALSIFNEYRFVENSSETIRLISNLLENNEIPIRVAHNNIRLNNLLFEANTYQFKSIVGFEVIMPGTILYDFGEAVKYLAATVREDEPNEELIKLNIEYFEEFVRGYAEKTKSILTDTEIMHLIDAVHIMAIESGIRYLNDYLNGEAEFKTEYKGQNLDKARNQFALAKEVELNRVKMENIINKYFS